MNIPGAESERMGGHEVLPGVLAKWSVVQDENGSVVLGHGAFGAHLSLLRCPGALACGRGRSPRRARPAPAPIAPSHHLPQIHPRADSARPWTVARRCPPNRHSPAPAPLRRDLPALARRLVLRLLWARTHPPPPPPPPTWYAIRRPGAVALGGYQRPEAERYCAPRGNQRGACATSSLSLPNRVRVRA